MTLSETLYNLRHKQGLSQEELAGKLNCSRQVISKWENGATTPDVEMLQKYSELFGVTMDSLVKGEPAKPAEKAGGNRKLLGILGLAISLIGCVSLIVVGAVTVFRSEAADKIAQSSMIVMDGMVIAILISVLFVAAGAVILIKASKHKQEDSP